MSGQFEAPQSLPTTPVVPFDPKVNRYALGLGPVLKPASFTGWKDESDSWKTTAYIHGQLGPMPVQRIYGPDAAGFVASISVNRMSTWQVGAGRHFIMCNDAGKIANHGVMTRMAEDEFHALYNVPHVEYLLHKGGWDAKVENLPLQFNFQIAGPRSLDILEAATREGFRDLKFMRRRETKIHGVDAGGVIEVLRMGMGGTLAYEVHGPAEDGPAVHDAIMQAGEQFGIRRLGWINYMMNHTENGFPQLGYHFLPTFEEDPGLAAWQAERAAHGLDDYWTLPDDFMKLVGSVGDDFEARSRTPIECNWGHSIDFDHEFPGRDVLLAEMENPRRKTVTLVWDPETVAEVLLSYFRPGEEPYTFMPFPLEPYMNPDAGSPFIQHSDWVLKDGEKVGVSSGRCYTHYYRAMISQATVDLEHAEIGTELSVLWGDPGDRQIEIPVKVDRFPFLDLPANQAINHA